MIFTRQATSSQNGAFCVIELQLNSKLFCQLVPSDGSKSGTEV